MRKISFFDFAVLGLFIIFIAVVGVSLKGSNKIVGKDSTLTIRVTNNNKIISKEAENKGKVFLNGTKNAVEITQVNKGQDYLDIVLKGRGEKDQEVYVFNGQRILIGQKAELHGSFFAQGLITEFKVKEN